MNEKTVDAAVDCKYSPLNALLLMLSGMRFRLVRDFLGELICVVLTRQRLFHGLLVVSCD